MKKDLPYIFIIGFNKTGTRSLHNFFLGNDYPSIHWDEGKLALTMLQNLIAGRKILSGYDEDYRVFSDMMMLNEHIDLQANQYFRIIDRDYPQSYFIYNNRKTEKWIQSRLCHLRDGNSFVKRSLMVNNTKRVADLKERWRIEKQRFECDIRSYFSDNDKYLEIDIENDDVGDRINFLLGQDLDARHWGHDGKTRRPWTRFGW